MQAIEQIWKAFATNSLGWLAVAAFLLALYGNWQRGRELTHVCEFVMSAAEIETVDLRGTVNSTSAFSICENRLAD